MRFSIVMFPLACLALAPGTTAQAYDGLVAQHAAANGVPESLVRRVIMRESRGNARAVSSGNYGLMQIRLGTARAMGYSGSAAGLLDPNTNMTYAVKYLAGAYRAAGGNADRAVSYYQRGYYGQAKARGVSPYAQPGEQPVATAAAAPVFDPLGLFTASTQLNKRQARVRTSRRAPAAADPLKFFAEGATEPEERKPRRRKHRS